MSRYDFNSMYARERYSLPDGWTWNRLEVIEGGTLVTGAVCAEVFKTGPRKGRTNWKKRDRSTERRVFIGDDDMKTWLATWEQKTGECYKCHGTGQQWYGWSQSDGNKYRPCPRCAATGMAAAP